MTDNITVPISIGELCDKYTILQIKAGKICDEIKLSKIEKELSYLQAIVDKLNINPETLTGLKEINEKLWNIEDNIRVKESNKEFDTGFIELARSVYITNDLRFEKKNSISKQYNSDIFEVKSYRKY
jgi:hypothetical protein